MNDQIRILLIEDSKEDRDTIYNALVSQFYNCKIDLIESFDELQKVYKISYYDIIICDFELSEYTGVDVLFYIRERELHTPFIFISDLKWEDATVDTLVLNGATDYVVKDNLKQLLFVVRREINRSQHYINTEQKLKTSEFRFRSIVQSINGILREVDLNTFENIYVSPQSMNILGYPPSDWIDNQYFWIEQIHPKDRKPALANLKKAVKEKENHTFEYRMINSEGEIVWIRDLLSVRFENGKPICLDGLMIDISDEKEIEIQRDIALQSERRRTKEQKCLWNITSMAEQEFTIPQLLQRSMMHIPVGFQHPSITGVCIRYDGEEYQTSNYEESDIKLVSENKKIRGGPLSIEVVYLDSNQLNTDEPFLREERHLLDTIMDVLSIKISKKLTTDDLKKHEQLLINTYELALLGRSL
ncbi:MAG: PAS domain-containing protein [Balneolaceae bacterium]|nr:PAS domain-containing protein [Balneolaceae bacterium]